MWCQKTAWCLKLPWALWEFYNPVISTGKNGSRCPTPKKTSSIAWIWIGSRQQVRGSATPLRGRSEAHHFGKSWSIWRMSPFWKKNKSICWFVVDYIINGTSVQQLFTDHRNIVRRPRHTWGTKGGYRRLGHIRYRLWLRAVVRWKSSYIGYIQGKRLSEYMYIYIRI